MGRNRKVARQLKYGPGATPPRAGGRDEEDGDDGGAGVREPRRPLPPSPPSGGAARPRPEETAPLIPVVDHAFTSSRRSEAT